MSLVNVEPKPQSAEILSVSCHLLIWLSADGPLDLHASSGGTWYCVQVQCVRNEHLPAALSVQSELMTDERCMLSVCEGLHSLSLWIIFHQSVMEKYGNIREF